MGDRSRRSPEKNPAAVSRCTALEGLRGVAILLVLAAQFWANTPHAQNGWLAAGVSKFASYGGSGVALFFVLSGFWIARNLLRDRGNAGFVGRFFLRRACRILPLYTLLLIGAFIAGRILFRLNADHWEPEVSEYLPRWSHAMFLQNVFMALTGSKGCEWLAPTWTLAVEVQFYLLIPFVVRLSAPRWLPVAAGAGLLACWAFRWGVHANSVPVFLSSLTLPGRADSFLTGAMVAWAWEQAPARAWLREKSRNVLAVGLGAGGAFVLSSEGAGIDLVGGGFVVAGNTLLSICVASVMITVLAHGHGRVARVLSSRLLTFWGGISFFVFLAHTPVNSLLHAAVLQDWPQTMSVGGVTVTLGSVATVALLGWISRRWFEDPIVAWSRQATFRGHRSVDVAPVAMPTGYAPPLVRWTRKLAVSLRRSTWRTARVAVRMRS